MLIQFRDSWSLVIKSVQEADAGKYICQVSPLGHFIDGHFIDRTFHRKGMSYTDKIYKR